MVNRKLFNTAVSPVQKVNPKGLAQVVNEAGGAAFAFADKHALAQFAVTGTFNNVFYATAESQLDKVKNLAAKVDSVFLAKLAVYGHETGRMKDVPAYLLAVLHARGESELLAKAFPRVIKTFKMLANFVQIVRSGVTGRKSFGSATKNIIKSWIAAKKAGQIYNGSIGLSNPSVADIIKLVHPEPANAEQDAVFAYLTDARNLSEKMGNLPENVATFELLKQGKTKLIPDVPFRALTNINLSVDQWRQIADNMPWDTLRQNLNQLHRKGVFDDAGYLAKTAARLGNAEEVRKVGVLPYQLFTTFQNTTDLPMELRNGLQDAAEVATENVPEFGGRVVLAVDVSGSMSSPVTGSNGKTPASVTRCVDVAGLMASCLLRNNKNARVLLFNSHGYPYFPVKGIESINLNPRDSIMTNAKTIANKLGGGTDLSLPFELLNKESYNAELIITVSDYESWAGTKFGSAIGWLNFKKRNPKAKLVNIDIQPYTTTQIPDNKDVLNIGGFSDAIWTAVAEFATCKSGDYDFVGHIETAVTF